MCQLENFTGNNVDLIKRLGKKQLQNLSEADEFHAIDVTDWEKAKSDFKLFELNVIGIHDQSTWVLIHYDMGTKHMQFLTNRGLSGECKGFEFIDPNFNSSKGLQKVEEDGIDKALKGNPSFFKSDNKASHQKDIEMQTFKHTEKP